MLRDRFGTAIVVGAVITYPYRHGAVMKNVDAVVTSVHEESGGDKVCVSSIDENSGRIYKTNVKRVDRITVLPYTREDLFSVASAKMGV